MVRLVLPALIGALLLGAPATTVAAAERKSARAAATKRTVTSELRALRASGELTPADYTRYASSYNNAKRAVRTLRGGARTQLSAVVKNVELLARRRQLVRGRLAIVFLTLDRNAAWWAAPRPLASGARISFPGSEIVWQYYPGQGLQIQWLGTFGKANGYLKARNVQNTRLKLLLDEALALVSQRANGVGWEYQFKFGGGDPPWVSGMAQATGMQALARAGVKYAQSDPARSAAYLTAARDALPIFTRDTPEGVRVPTATGAHYAIYSFSRGLRVQNAFTQTISALHDYVQLTADPVGLQAFLAGEAQLRAETPSYDTGAWSMYSNASEANLNYHNESTAFLTTLCNSLTADQAAAALNGGVAPGGLPPLDPRIYCDTAARYKSYLTVPPAIALQPSTLRKGRESALRFSLSKISKVSLTVRRAGEIVFQRTVTLGHGNRSVKLKAAKTGPVDITLIATDLAGNRAMTTGTATVERR